jgi:hypothetical protein
VKTNIGTACRCIITGSGTAAPPESHACAGHIHTQLQLQPSDAEHISGTNTVRYQLNTTLGELASDAHSTCSISVGQRILVPDVESGSGAHCWVMPGSFQGPDAREGIVCRARFASYKVQVRAATLPLQCFVQPSIVSYPWRHQHGC